MVRTLALIMLWEQSTRGRCTDQPESVGLKHHAVEPHHVLVVDGVHDGRLLQEVGRAALDLLFAQAFHSDLELWVNYNQRISR